jgi:hypothetical protein
LQIAKNKISDYASAKSEITGDVRVGRDYKANANELCTALEKEDQHIFLDDIAKEYFEMNPFPVEVFS